MEGFTSTASDDSSSNSATEIDYPPRMECKRVKVCHKSSKVRKESKKRRQRKHLASSSSISSTSSEFTPVKKLKKKELAISSSSGQSNSKAKRKSNRGRKRKHVTSSSSSISSESASLKKSRTKKKVSSSSGPSKLGEVKKQRKWKHVVRSSSDSTASPADKESDFMTGKSVKKMKKHRKQTPKGRNYHLDIFQKHYHSLVTMIRSDLVSVSGLLFSNGFVSDDTLNEVLTGHRSQSTKAAILLSDVCGHLKINPEMLLEFVKLLEQEKSFDILTSKIRGT